MKCTSKEWDTCRVEKMGCRGCYYDCIRKDKIRAKIKDLKENGHWDFLEDRDMEKTINILQKILEEGESNEND